ncbi:MAG: aldehyde dehydrogenase family protein [Caldisericia bacterium]
MADHLQNLINGVWKDSPSGKTFENRDPANGELIATATLSTKNDVNEAVAAAKEAFQKWKALPAPARGDILIRTAQILEERKENRNHHDTWDGKVIAEARGDVQEAIDMLSHWW